MSSILKWFAEDGDEDSEDEKSLYIPALIHVGYRVATGMITYLNQDYGLIDDNFYFDFDVVCNAERRFRIGDMVSYAAIRRKIQEPLKVTKVVPYTDSLVCDDEWVYNERRDEEHRTEVRILHGKVAGTKGNVLHIHPPGFSCSLKDVSCEFLPIKGDLVSIIADVPLNNEIINVADELLYIKHVKPILLRNKIGNVTFMYENKDDICKGVIENETLFSSEFCHIGFKPTFGEPVKYLAIESDQGKYKWRALSVHPVNETQKKNKIQSFGLKDYYESKREDIVIEGDSEVGPLKLNETQKITLTVKNKGKTKKIISRCSFSSTKARSQLNLLTPSLKDRIELEPGNHIDYHFECRARFLGQNTESFKIYFDNFVIGSYFHIYVITNNDTMKIINSSQEEGELLTKVSEHPWKNFKLCDVLCGEESLYDFRSKNIPKYPSYELPVRLISLSRQCVNELNPRILEKRQQALKEYCSVLGQELTISNYQEWFHTALYLEESENTVSYEKYSLSSVILEKDGLHLCLKVSNLAEGFVFSLGMNVCVRQLWWNFWTPSEIGYIDDCSSGIIRLLFSTNFLYTYDGNECSLRFLPSRTTFIRYHSAVDMAMERLGSSYLFPTTLIDKPPVIKIEAGVGDFHQKPYFLSDSEKEDDESSLFEVQYDENGISSQKVIPERKLTWFNNNLNPSQKNAVLHILEGRGRSLPYIIIGPPGTGKTVTITEIVLQAYTLISDSRILITTPSNSAADTIFRFLIQHYDFTPGEIVRILSHTRAAVGNIPEDLAPYCVVVRNDQIVESRFRWGDVQISQRHELVGTQRIVVGTCCSIGVLHSLGLQKDLFTHVIIDDAGEASEPLTLIPMTLVDQKRGVIVLCGDTEQLGPSCYSEFGGSLGLRRTLLERLMVLPPYLRRTDCFPFFNGFDPRCITKLIFNYRSVPEILTLPNKMFYNGELIPKLSGTNGVEADLIRAFNVKARGDHSPAIIFQPVPTSNCQDRASFSSYDPGEIWLTICHLRRLYSIGLEPKDVGIITPYKKQVEKIRLVLTALGIMIPKVGTVEEFQGQERYAIILNVVRGVTCLHGVSRAHLGFLAAPRRLNFAINRARAILVIIADPNGLTSDPYWVNIIRYCSSHNGYLNYPS